MFFYTNVPQSARQQIQSHLALRRLLELEICYRILYHDEFCFRYEDIEAR